MSPPASHLKFKPVTQFNPKNDTLVCDKQPLGPLDLIDSSKSTDKASSNAARRKAVVLFHQFCVLSLDSIHVLVVHHEACARSLCTIHHGGSDRCDKVDWEVLDGEITKRPQKHIQSRCEVHCSLTSLACETKQFSAESDDFNYLKSVFYILCRYQMSGID